SSLPSAPLKTPIPVTEATDFRETPAFIQELPFSGRKQHNLRSSTLARIPAALFDQRGPDPSPLIPLEHGEPVNARCLRAVEHLNRSDGLVFRPIFQPRHERPRAATAFRQQRPQPFERHAAKRRGNRADGWIWR